ncbi:NmrA-like family protein [Umbelopsis sp. PMI_123]|nr:NmrA-like family protein [Umbelopsis sp. PMI_123]
MLKILIAGCTGRLAQQIIQKLLERPEVGMIRGVARNPSKMPEDLKNHPKMNYCTAEANDAKKIEEACIGIDVVVCCYQGYYDIMYEGQKVLIKAAEAQKVPRFFTSDFTLDYTKLKIGQHEGKDLMIKINQEIRNISSITPTFMLIGAFMETWLGYLKIWNPETHTFTYWGTGNERYHMTTYANAAEYTAAAICNPDATGKISVAGDYKSVRELASIYEENTGEKAKLVCAGSMDDLCDFMHAEKERIKDGNKWEYMYLYYHYYMLNGQTALDEPLSNDKFPDVKPVTLRDFLAENDITNKESLQTPL